MTVGFQPAKAPVIGAPAAATTAASQPAGEGGLFAALLAMLAPGIAGSSLTNITLPDAKDTALQQGLAQAKDLLPKDLEAQLAATAGKLGIDLSTLDNLLAGIETAADATADPDALVDAVTGLVEALAAMTDAPTDAEGADFIDDGQLEAAADALLALIGATPPPPPPVPTTGETFTELVGDLNEALTGAKAPSGGAPSPAIEAPTGDEVGAAAPASAAVAGSGAASEPASDGPRAPLVERLTQLLDDAAKAVAPANPQLAEKLAALAKALPTLPEEVLTALEAAPTDESAPELASLIDQIARPRPTQRTASPVFTAPRLELATLGADTDNAPVTDANPAPKPPALGSATPEPAPVASARPDAPAPSPTPNQQAPAAPPPETGTDKPAEVTQTPAAATAQQASAAAPAALRVVQAAYQQPATPINLPQVAFEVVRQFEAGNSRFQIRLDPAELGRIDVQLDVDRAGNVNARMVVERPETLDLMQRDQRALQQALQQAGLDANRTSLEFSLRQNPSGGDGFNEGRNQGRGGPEAGGPLSADAGAEAITEIYRGSAAPGALNLFV